MLRPVQGQTATDVSTQKTRSTSKIRIGLFRKDLGPLDLESSKALAETDVSVGPSTI